MASIARGPRPDVTPAQWLGSVPVVANMLHAFGVFDLSDEQQESLEKTIAYAIALVGGDALLRIGRNYRDARVDSAALASDSEPRADVGPDDEDDILVDDEILEEDRVADELEAEPLPEPQTIRPTGERPEPQP